MSEEKKKYVAPAVSVVSKVKAAFSSAHETPPEAPKAKRLSEDEWVKEARTLLAEARGNVSWPTAQRIDALLK